jgi:glycosyltransferase involved in cell wall biosynthesis
VEGLSRLIDKIPFDAVNEVFAVDGGSTDGTLEIYKKHNIKVISQKSKGRGEAFRIAARESDCDYLLFFSPDGNDFDNSPKKIMTW